MLARYRLVRGRRPPDDPLPAGARIDVRMHTRHVLAPKRDMVERYLAAASDEAWERFRSDYLALLEQRFQNDPGPFTSLADRARDTDVYLGCSCPTARNPDVSRCHTVAALEFMRSRFPDLDIQMPPGTS
ncbi:MAG: hypothetical protein H6746_01735 [Deltaproteobacteria bacterium]|nr:hypothetical protein [Deltaproteobacteria bacterium]